MEDISAWARFGAGERTYRSPQLPPDDGLLTSGRSSRRQLGSVGDAEEALLRGVLVVLMHPGRINPGSQSHWPSVDPERRSLIGGSVQSVTIASFRVTLKLRCVRRMSSRIMRAVSSSSVTVVLTGASW